MIIEELDKTAYEYAKEAYYPAPDYGWYESDDKQMRDVLENAFKAGANYALGKIDDAKEQKEHDSNYIEMQKAFAQFDKACDRTIHALDKLINTLCKI